MQRSVHDEVPDNLAQATKATGREELSIVGSLAVTKGGVGKRVDIDQSRKYGVTLLNSLDSVCLGQWSRPSQ